MEASNRKMDRFMKGLERGPKDGWIGEVGVKGEWNGGGVRDRNEGGQGKARKGGRQKVRNCISTKLQKYEEG